MGKPGSGAAGRVGMGDASGGTTMGVERGMGGGTGKSASLMLSAAVTSDRAGAERCEGGPISPCKAEERRGTDGRWVDLREKEPTAMRVLRSKARTISADQQAAKRRKALQSAALRFPRLSRHAVSPGCHPRTVPPSIAMEMRADSTACPATRPSPSTSFTHAMLPCPPPLPLRRQGKMALRKPEGGGVSSMRLSPWLAICTGGGRTVAPRNEKLRLQRTMLAKTHPVLTVVDAVGPVKMSQGAVNWHQLTQHSPASAPKMASHMQSSQSTHLVQLCHLHRAKRDGLPVHVQLGGEGLLLAALCWQAHHLLVVGVAVAADLGVGGAPICRARRRE